MPDSTRKCRPHHFFIRTPFLRQNYKKIREITVKYMKLKFPQIPLNLAEIRGSVEVERSALVYVIIQPVCIQIVCMGSPHQAVVCLPDHCRDNSSPEFQSEDPLLISRLYSPSSVTRSYSGCPITKIFLPPSAMAQEQTCLLGFCQDQSVSLQLRMSSIGTSVCLECGARNMSSKPLTSGILRFRTLCQNSPNILWSSWRFLSP